MKISVSKQISTCSGMTVDQQEPYEKLRTREGGVSPKLSGQKEGGSRIPSWPRRELLFANFLLNSKFD